MKPWQRLTDIFGQHQITEEMSKKYRGTILGISDPDDPTFKTIYGYYHGINDNGDFHILKDKESNRMQLSVDTNFEVFIPDPPRGMYNTKMGAVLFYRKPFRQHKRGLGDGTAMIELLDNTIRKGDIRNWFESYIYDVLHDQQIRGRTLGKCFELTNEFGSAAINREFAMSLHTVQPTGYHLYYENRLIGDITEDTIMLGSDLFYQEVIDSQDTWCPNHKVRIM